MEAVSRALILRDTRRANAHIFRAERMCQVRFYLFIRIPALRHFFCASLADRVSCVTGCARLLRKLAARN